MGLLWLVGVEMPGAFTTCPPRPLAVPGRVRRLSGGRVGRAAEPDSAEDVSGLDDRPGYLAGDLVAGYVPGGEQRLGAGQPLLQFSGEAGIVARAPGQQ